jgi:hypothetical protein
MNCFESSPCSDPDYATPYSSSSTGYHIASASESPGRSHQNLHISLPTQSHPGRAGFLAFYIAVSKFLGSRNLQIIPSNSWLAACRSSKLAVNASHHGLMIAKVRILPFIGTSNIFAPVHGHGRDMEGIKVISIETPHDGHHHGYHHTKGSRHHHHTRWRRFIH